MKYCPSCGVRLDMYTEGSKNSQNQSSEATGTKNDDIMSDYTGETPVAKPGKYDWKKEMKRKRATLIKNQTDNKPLPQQDSELSKFGDLIVGEGLQRVF